jgi:hypothetical protein
LTFIGSRVPNYEITMSSTQNDDAHRRPRQRRGIRCGSSASAPPTRPRLLRKLVTATGMRIAIFGLLAVVLLPCAGSAAGMWYVGVNACNIDRSRRINGVMSANGARSFVSKAECERGAQDLLDALRSAGMIINRVWCEQQ